MKRKIVCIVGPTASGKTALGIELAKRWNGEIISADSMQVYKKLDIGTAKPTLNEQREIQHHLIDICDITQKYNVADFQKQCFQKMDEIEKKGKNVIIVGGTGLYISAVVNEMQFDDQMIDEEYRKSLFELAKQHSKEYVWNLLNEIDPETAKSLHPNNLKRVIRAIEIANFSSKLKSEHMLEEKTRMSQKNTNYDFYIFNIVFDREKLYNRINQRVDQMMKEGLLEEAKMVYEMNLPLDNTCMQAIGYKELFEYFRQEKSLDECIEKLKQETRKYAKRQITWFKNKLQTYDINGEEHKENIIERILDIINQ